MAKRKRREIEEEINKEAQNDVSIANGDSEYHKNQPKKGAAAQSKKETTEK